MRKHLSAQSRGSVESFLIILPQVFVFLIMFQLVFMQFDVMKSSSLSQGEISKSAISGETSGYESFQLSGGGVVLVKSERSILKKFIDFTFISSKKITSIAVDENQGN